jgi:ABC-2 type transport system ATP-binding protein
VTPMLEATELRLSYGKIEALRGLDLTIPRGKIVALVGPNGAGKTSLLHLAVGLLSPSSGAIRTLGSSPAKQPTQVLARVGFVAQDRPLYRDFSIADTLELGRHLNSRWDGGVARGRLERLGLDLRRTVGSLSGGEQAQVALALALGKIPELLMLDEPVAHLDPLARRDFMRELVDAVVERQMSVVLSSHLVSDLERVCDYLVIISKGELQLAGEIDVLLRQHSLVAGNGSAPRLPDGVHTVSGAGIGAAGSVVVRWDRPDQRALLSSEPVDLEELVLAYLSVPSERAFPGPLDLAGRHS